MQKVPKQSLHKIAIYENKPRPGARDRSQNTANEGCKNFNNYQYYNQHDMSTSAPTEFLHKNGEEKNILLLRTILPSQQHYEY